MNACSTGGASTAQPAAVSSTICGHFVDGKALGGSSGRTAPLFNPATGQQAGTVALANAADVDAAAAAAKRAFPGWAVTPPLRRARILNRFLGLLEQNIERLAAVVTAEDGKVLSDAKGEIQRGIEVVEFAAGAPQLLKREMSENVDTHVDSYAIRQLLGVVAGITPFNFPVMVPLWMFPIALACGNSFILKPSQRDPSASLLMAQWLTQAGLPDGVFNVVQGDRDAVDALLAHPDIAAVSFVGSTPVARHVYETAAAHNKRAQAPGGRQESYGGDAGCRSRPGRRCPHGRGLRFGRRALYGHFRRGGGRPGNGRRAGSAPGTASAQPQRRPR